jgi:2-iminobutanoate/2-iminopropanoate deaminase
MESLSETRRGFLSRFSHAVVAIGAVMAATESLSADDEPKKRSRSRGRGRVAYPTRESKFYSRGVRYENTIYISGVLGTDQQGRIERDFELQAMRAMLNLKESVERCGSKIQNVLQCTCYLTQSMDFAKFNEVYSKFFPDSPPARSTVVVKELLTPGAKVEIDCVCHK